MSHIHELLRVQCLVFTCRLLGSGSYKCPCVVFVVFREVAYCCLRLVGVPMSMLEGLFLRLMLPSLLLLS